MTKPEDIPQDVWDRADACAASVQMPGGEGHAILRGELARAILAATEAERERWKPAAVYFERYCQDEADDVENCVCGLRQHEDAKAFAAAIRTRTHP